MLKFWRIWTTTETKTATSGDASSCKDSAHHVGHGPEIKGHGRPDEKISSAVGIFRHTLEFPQIPLSQRAEDCDFCWVGHSLILGNPIEDASRIYQAALLP